MANHRLGYTKQRMLEEQERGCSSVDDKFACPNCIDDEAIRTLIENDAVSTRCSYCGRATDDTPIAAPVDDVIDLVNESLRSEWNDPADELPYESREGGYQGEVLTTEDILWGLLTGHDELIADIIDAFEGRVWCQRDYFGPRPAEYVIFGWEQFVDYVKNQSRYLFLTVPPDTDGLDPKEALPPSLMLSTIGEVVSELGLCRTLSEGTPVFRARVHHVSKNYSTARELGTPPRQRAIFSQRMSPAGIPMFYGALEEETAYWERWSEEKASDNVATIGTFRPSASLRLVDLTSIPPMPSLFDADRRHLRSSVAFLRRFAADVSKPVARDRAEHVDYVPTQIVTEYFRRVFPRTSGDTIHGVLYKSARRPDGTCCVLFIENGACVDQSSQGAPENGVYLVLQESRRRWGPRTRRHHLCALWSTVLKAFLKS